MAAGKGASGLYDRIMSAVNKGIEESLRKDVVPAVADMMMENVRLYVYNDYYPAVYDRRGTDGGLGDSGNVAWDMPSSTQLCIWNATQPASGPGWTTDKDLPLTVETGVGYDFTFPDDPRGYEKPRPFMAATQDDVEKAKDKLGEMIAERVRRQLRASGFRAK